jgi:hypothetical protein
VPIVEAMMALALADAAMAQQARNGAHAEFEGFVSPVDQKKRKYEEAQKGESEKQ